MVNLYTKYYYQYHSKLEKPMRQHKKKLGLALASLFLATIPPSSATSEECCPPPVCNQPVACPPQACPEDCFDPCACGIEFSAEFIYWKPCVELDYAAIVPDPFTTGTTPTRTVNNHYYKNVNLNWTPGFRVQVAKNNFLCCNWNLSGSYLWLDIDHKSRSSAPASVIPVAFAPTFVTSPLFSEQLTDELDPATEELTEVIGKYETTYQNWDALFSYNFSCDKCNTFQPFFGVGGLILNQKLRITALADDELPADVDSKELRWKSDFFGVGLKMGTGYVFECNCIKLYANASATLLVGQHEGRNRQINFDASGNETVYNYRDNDHCQFVPGCNLGVGFIFSGCDYAIKIGYEFTGWSNISAPRRFFGDDFESSANSTASEFATFGVHGLVAGLDFKF